MTRNSHILPILLEHGFNPDELFDTEKFSYDVVVAETKLVLDSYEGGIETSRFWPIRTPLMEERLEKWKQIVLDLKGYKNEEIETHGFTKVKPLEVVLIIYLNPMDKSVVTVYVA